MEEYDKAIAATAPPKPHNPVPALIRERNELRQREFELAQNVANVIEEYRGSLLDAIRIGLVKPALPVPTGWLRWISENK